MRNGQSERNESFQKFIIYLQRQENKYKAAQYSFSLSGTVIFPCVWSFLQMSWLSTMNMNLYSSRQQVHN